MKKSLFFVLSLVSILIFFSLHLSIYAQNNNFTLDYLPDKAEGKIILTGTADCEAMLMLTKDNKSTWLSLDIKGNTFSKSVWLTDGLGDYQVNIMIPVGGGYYSFGSTNIVQNTLELDKYLQPDEYIESNDENIINLANSITKDAHDSYTKSKLIFEWVRTNISYDMKKYRRIISGNTDNSYGGLETIRTKKGVCYDFSTLIAALGRANGLRVKVIKGDLITSKKEVYHAWNEIYIPEEDRWISMDATLSSIYEGGFFDTSDFSKNHRLIV